MAITIASTTGACLSIVASLTFLGIGVVPPDPTWGGELAIDLSTLYDRPFGPFAPGLLIVATVWSLNALADAMRRNTKFAAKVRYEPADQHHQLRAHGPAPLPRRRRRRCFRCAT